MKRPRKTAAFFFFLLRRYDDRCISQIARAA